MLRRKLSAEDLKIISEPIDFIGVNVYQPSNGTLNKEGYKLDERPKTMMGWVIDGRCLYWTVRQYWERYHLPIMRITDETGIPETRYFPVIAIDDSGQQKVALFPSMSADQFTRSGKPYLEEVINKLLKQSSLQAPGIQKRIAELKAQTEQLEQEIDEILMEKLR